MKVYGLKEKKALERIDYIQDFIIENGQYNADVNDMEYFSKILNLIEKQSKEIEELKAISEYREKIIKGLGLKTLPKTITGFRKLIENNDKKWVDKIKGKIEEVKDGTYDAKIVLQSLLKKE